MTTISGASFSFLVKHEVSPVRIIAAGAAWRLFGSRGSGETLVEAMSGDDEQNRMLAGISLVKAGQRSFDLIEKKIHAGAASKPLVCLLPDLDGPRTRAIMNQIVESGPEDLQETARQCIDLLDRMEME